MQINFKHTIQASTIDEAIIKVTHQLKTAGFGVLTTIDFAAKLREKLSVEIPPTIILGACNPALAYEVYQQTTDFLSLLPCNVVVREIASNNYSIEMIKPSQMVKQLGNRNIDAMAQSMDEDMLNLLTKI